MNSSSPEEKYSLLFTLPKSTITVFTIYIILLAVISALSLITGVLNSHLIFIFFGLNLLQIYMIKYVGGYAVPYSSIRRIMSAESSSLVPLLLILLVGLFYQKTTFLYIALAFTISFRLIIYYGAFFDRISISLLMAVLPLTPFLAAIAGPADIIPILVLPSMSTFLLLRLDKISKNKVNEKTTSLFKRFMSAWVSEYPFPLEEFLEKNSERIDTKVYSIVLKSEDSKPIRIVIPYIHPGPFKPVGSYNLPYEIKKNFPSDNVIVMHAPIDHKFNIPSHNELRSLLKMIGKPHKVNCGTKLSMLKRIKSTNFEVSIIGILNNYRLIIIDPTTPCEDFPPEFSEKILTREKLIVVDAHNNLGPKPDGFRVKEVEDLIKKATTNLKWQNEFFVGYSHIDPWNSEDIGPGGVDCITVSFKDGKRFSFIVFDANNAKPGLIKRLVSDLNYENLMILTTDSHFNAAKITTEKGYKALGEETAYHDLLKICRYLISSSLDNLKFVKEVELIEHKVKIKVIGEKALLHITNTLNASLSFFKKLWIILFMTTLFLFFVFGLVNI